MNHYEVFQINDRMPRKGEKSSQKGLRWLMWNGKS